MANDLIARYIWIVDTLRRYGRLSRKRINELWLSSRFSQGDPLPERTFYHYRRAIEENFNITILCDSAGRYYIDDDSDRSRAYTDWLLDSFAINSALADAGDAGDRVEVEPVPSAREFLPPVLEAIRRNSKITFIYAGFNRSRAEHNIVFHPYFLKRYKQRWYMVGLREKSNDIRTYALDRVRELHISDLSFSMPEDITADDIFGEIIGITSSRGETKNVKLLATPTQAKYMRALPLHPSQQEEVHDSYSIFNYRLKLNWELVHEILGFGAEIKVLAPPELKVMVVEDLKKTLDQYSS